MTVKWNLQIAFKNVNRKSDIYLYLLNNTLIPNYINFRDLCIIFDYNIKCNIHINNICSKDFVISNNNSYHLVKYYTTYIRQLIKDGSSIWITGNDFIGINKLIEKIM